MVRITSKFIEFFAKQPLLWDIFEYVFGTDKQKLKLYRKKVGNPKKILDFGCSSGNVTGAFLDFEYTGVDIDKQLIKHAQNKWKKYKNVKFVAMDILKSKKTLGKFEAILFAGTGHHLPDDLYLKIFSKFAKYLNKGGEIHYIDTIKSDSSSPIIARWLCSIDRGKYIRTKKHYISLLNKISTKYNIISTSEIYMSNDFLPHPTYLYVKLRKR
jgi:SAM-dependent methyltransferase